MTYNTELAASRATAVFNPHFWVSNLDCPGLELILAMLNFKGNLWLHSLLFHQFHPTVSASSIVYADISGWLLLSYYAREILSDPRVTGIWNSDWNEAKVLTQMFNLKNASSTTYNIAFLPHAQRTKPTYLYGASALFGPLRYPKKNDQEMECSTWY